MFIFAVNKHNKDTVLKQINKQMPTESPPDNWLSWICVT